jgi:hypothetical protein
MFTLCFQHTVLVAVPCLFVFLAALVVSFQLRSAKKKKSAPLPWTLLLSAKFVSAD